MSYNNGFWRRPVLQVIRPAGIYEENDNKITAGGAAFRPFPF